MYGTGDATVDEQHRKLFDLINAVLDHLDQKKTAGETARAWQAMEEYTKTHFSCEEDIMEKKKCSACDANKKAHHIFLNSIERLATLFKTSGPTEEFGKEFQKFISSWFRMHIMAIDAKLRETA